jgi:hypothetical protein
MDARNTQSSELIATSGDAESRGTIWVEYFTSGDRFRRATKASVKCLAVTTICGLIPGAHFILVPMGLLIVTPVVTFRAYRVRSTIVSATIDCPKCHAPITVLTTQERYPLYENCASCHRQAIIRKVTSESALKNDA